MARACPADDVRAEPGHRGRDARRGETRTCSGESSRRLHFHLPLLLLSRVRGELQRTFSFRSTHGAANRFPARGARARSPFTDVHPRTSCRGGRRSRQSASVVVALAGLSRPFASGAFRARHAPCGRTLQQLSLLSSLSRPIFLSLFSCTTRTSTGLEPTRIGRFDSKPRTMRLTRLNGTPSLSRQPFWDRDVNDRDAAESSYDFLDGAGVLVGKLIVAVYDLHLDYVQKYHPSVTEY